MPADQNDRLAYLEYLVERLYSALVAAENKTTTPYQALEEVDEDLGYDAVHGRLFGRSELERPPKPEREDPPTTDRTVLPFPRQRAEGEDDTPILLPIDTVEAMMFRCALHTLKASNKGMSSPELALFVAEELGACIDIARAIGPEGLAKAFAEEIAGITNRDED